MLRIFVRQPRTLTYVVSCEGLNTRTHSTQAQATTQDTDEVEVTVEVDKFTKEFLDQRIQLSGFQRVLLSAGSSLAAILNPAR